MDADEDSPTTLHLGLLVNPLAGLGGSLALKGSDGPALREAAAGLTPAQRARSRERMKRALHSLAGAGERIRYSCWDGEMGESTAHELGLAVQVLGGGASAVGTSADDTRRAAQTMLSAGVDLLLFAGGDGTARDICDAIGLRCPVLGVPAGVKMHSGVFAVSPEAAGELLVKLADGGLVGLRRAEVRDIDEEAFRRDVVRSRFYGELLVPGESGFLQHTKVGGREDPALAAADIASWLTERAEAGRMYLLGPGSTTAAIKSQLGITPTLLGVDVVRDGELLAADADEATLLRLLADGAPASIVVTAIGGQGHVFGRGNQQFSPAVIRAVGTDNVHIVATRGKLAALEGRPLLVDSNDPELDQMLRGYRAVTTGYDEQLLYRLA